MRVEYSEPLAPWVFIGKVRTGHMRYIGWMDVMYVFCLFLKKVSWPLEKAKPRQPKKNNDSTSRVHNDQHRAACTPLCTSCSSQESRRRYIFQRLSSDAAYSQRCG